MADVQLSDNPAGYWSQPVNRWQFASGLAVVLLVCTGIGMTVAGHAKDAAIRASRSDLDRVSLELTPKLDELIELLQREPRVTEQHQEQHIHVPLDAAERERLRDERIRDFAAQIMREPSNAVQ